MKRLLVIVVTSLFLLANTNVNPLVKAEAFDLSEYQGDYVIKDNLAIFENLVPESTAESFLDMTDEEAMELIDAVIDDVIDNPEVYYRWDYENESNLYFISIRDDYLVLRDYMVPFDMISDIFYLNQHVFHNNRVVKFNALRSFMSHGREDFDDRNFFVFHEGEIFVVNIADKSVARYEPLDVSELPPTVRLEKLKMPTDEEMSYSELSTLEELGPELILLSGEIIDYNDFYLDYSEAVLQMEEYRENHHVILRFFYSPLEPLEVGDKVEVYGKLTNYVNILADNPDQLAVLVQWIEVRQ